MQKLAKAFAVYVEREFGEELAPKDVLHQLESNEWVGLLSAELENGDAWQVDLSVSDKTIASYRNDELEEYLEYDTLEDIAEMLTMQPDFMPW